MKFCKAISLKYLFGLTVKRWREVMASYEFIILLAQIVTLALEILILFRLSQLVGQQTGKKAKK